jgi:hypothetical protein
LALAVQVVRLEQQVTKRLHRVLLVGHLHLVIILVLLEAAAAVLQVLVIPVVEAPVVEGVAHLELGRLRQHQIKPLAVYLLAGFLGQAHVMLLLSQILLTT